jgi:elongation factor G
MVCQQVRDMLKSNAVAITLPIGKKMISRYRGFSENEAIVWHDTRATFDVVAIPEEMLDEVKEYRSILIEALIMMKIC